MKTLAALTSALAGLTLLTSLGAAAMTRSTARRNSRSSRNML